MKYRTFRSYFNYNFLSVQFNERKLLRNFQRIQFTENVQVLFTIIYLQDLYNLQIRKYPSYTVPKLG